ncbi:hypothetical protein [Hydrogenovibrio kuenenii]|uniref:hypothetical protein n=1 Tax=Hydrogenovibrio kuenenii TaxID=63658 RepID=UPI0004652220|nr:hypothetical protein [Hydrogenovibrio kuenenii]
MGFWFEKGESRRFPRVEMPVQVHIMPSDPIRNDEIYALGINYFPPSVEKKIQKTKLDIWHSVKHIQEQKDILEPVFMEAVDLIDTFGEVIKNACRGKNPARSKPKDTITFQKLLNGFQKSSSLEEAAPRTFQHFDQMNQKFLVYSKNLVFSLQKSSATKFVSTMNFQTEFDIDKTIANFEKPKFKQVPLAQALFHLSQYLNFHLEAYTEYLKDLQIPRTAKKIAPRLMSISACGLAIKANKRYPMSSKVDLLFYFPETDETLKLSATVVRSVTLPSDDTECNALDYYFPTSRDLNIIQRQVELLQINRCLETSVR